METRSNSIFELRTRAQATIIGICVRTVISFWKSAYAMGAAKGAWKGRQTVMSFSTCLLPSFSPVECFNRKWWHEWRPEGVCLGTVFTNNQRIAKCVSTEHARSDCMRAPAAERPGRLKIARAFRANGLEARVGAPMVPQSVFQD